MFSFSQRISPPDVIDSAYHAGWLAAQAKLIGGTPIHNPYEPGSDCWQAWKRGYNSALHENMERRLTH